MFSKSVCRLCLAMDSPMRVVADIALQDIYESLTRKTFNVLDKPVVACLLCYKQLWKCYKFRIKSVKADDLLSQLLHNGEVIQRESVASIDREACNLSHGLSVSPLDYCNVADLVTEYSKTFEDVNIKEEAASDADSDGDMAIPSEMVEVESIEIKCEEPDEEFSGESEGMAKIDNSDDEEMWDDDELDNKSQLQFTGTEYKDQPESLTVNINPATILGHSDLVGKKVVRITSGHTRRKGKYNPYECPECTYTSARKGDLETHLRVHTGEKPFECEMCDQKFRDKSNLRVHLRIHTGDKPFKCPVCENEFKHISTLKKHLKGHNGEKPYECSICLNKFSEKSALVAHVRIHTGETPFECPVCHCKFKNKGNLKIHFRRHTGDKPYVCSICERRFIQKSSLDRHLRSHSGLKPFECEICERKYTERSSLNVHLKRHHPDDIIIE